MAAAMTRIPLVMRNTADIATPQGQRGSDGQTLRSDATVRKATKP